jgi:hypothetical protein
VAGDAPWRDLEQLWRALLVKKSAGVLKVPRRTHQRKNAAQAEAFKNTLARRLWQLRPGDGARVRVWVMDEHRYGLISHQRRCWGMRRVRAHAPYRTRYQWGYVATALEVEGKHEGLCVFLPCVSLDASACFLEELAASDPQAVHVVIADQAGFHLKADDARVPVNVRLLPLPPYCPELNPVEHVGSLIRTATANRVFESLEAMELAIEDRLRPLWTQPQKVHSLVGSGWMRSQVNASSKFITDPFLTANGITLQGGAILVARFSRRKREFHGG